MKAQAGSPHLSLLSSYSDEMLRSLSRRWLGKEANRLRKDEFLSALPDALNDAARVRKVARGLSDQERGVLGVLKQTGGNGRSDAVAMALLFGQFTPLPKPHRREAIRDLFREMLGAGLVATPYFTPYAFQFSDQPVLLRADPRLLAFVDLPSPQSLSLGGLPDPGRVAAEARRTRSVTLDLIAVVQEVAALGGFRSTKLGTLRSNDLRHVTKNLGWDRCLPEGVTQLREPLSFFLALLSAAGLLVADQDHLVLARGADEALQRPPEVLFVSLLHAYLRLLHWKELPVPARSLRETALPAGRRLVIEGLRSLPDQGRCFVEAAGFSHALLARVGEFFHLSPHQSLFPESAATNKHTEYIQRRWRSERAQSWVKDEQPWIEAALTGPLQALGFVQTATDPSMALFFRLTDIGRMVLLPDGQPVRDTTAVAVTRRAWVVQATFEVLVFLEHATAAQLCFMVRHGERLENQQHTALYRLTGEALHGALSRGSHIEDVLSTLEAGGGPLPQNVRVQLQQWAAKREQATVYHDACLLEFESAAARDLAQLQGVVGRKAGERFILLSPEATTDEIRTLCTTVINYRSAPLRCLYLREDGEVVLMGREDLLIRAQMNRRAEALGPGRWQISRDSLRQAMAAGESLVAFTAWLGARATGSVPPPLMLMLRAWAGELLPFVLGQLTVLQCPDEASRAVLVQTAALMPYLRGLLGQRHVVIEPSAVELVRTVLSRMGAAVVTDKISLTR